MLNSLRSCAHLSVIHRKMSFILIHEASVLFRLINAFFVDASLSIYQFFVEIINFFVDLLKHDRLSDQLVDLSRHEFFIKRDESHEIE